MERDICISGKAYWDRIRGERPAPLRDDFDPIDIPHLLTNTVFMEVVDGGKDFLFKVIGAEIREHFFDNWTGRSLSSLPHVDADGPIFRHLRQATRDRTPVSAPAPYVGPKKDIMVNDEIILPLVDASGNVTHLLIFIEFLSRSALDRWD